MDKPHSSTYDNQLIELESVDSTNNYAMRRIHAGLARDGQVCLAHHQTAGRGQRGRSWQSEAGQNLMMSLVIEPSTGTSPLNLDRQFLFSAAVALGILDLVKTFAKNNWRIKWPNDIYWSDRKAAGILIESVVQGSGWPFAVVGIGMNLNADSFPADLPHAISLKQISGVSYDAVSVARLLVPSIQNRIGHLKSDPGQILSEYNAVLYKINQPISFRKGDEIIVADLRGVDESGFLLTETGKYKVGEIEFIINA